MRRDGSGGGEDVDMEAGAEAGDAGDRDKVDRVGEKDGALVGVVVASRTTTRECHIQAMRLPLVGDTYSSDVYSCNGDDTCTCPDARRYVCGTEV